MSLERYELICVNENGDNENIIKSKGKSLKIGYYMNCDYVHENPLAKNVHCEINIDAFGRITIVNYSTEYPILLNDVPVLKKRPLLHGMKISVLDKDFIWKNINITLGKTDKQEMDNMENENELVTPTKQQLVEPEQPPNSEPKDILSNRVVHVFENRLTIHNFKYSINSNESENTLDTFSDQESDVEHSKIISPAPKSITRSPLQNCELLNNTFTQQEKSLKVQLSICNRSDMTVTSYSPRIAGVQIDKSFAHVKTTTTPKSVYSTPKGNYMVETSCNDSKLINICSPNLSKINRSMHVVDLTTPSKYHNGSPHFKKSILKHSLIKSAQKSSVKPKVLAKVIDEQLKNNPQLISHESEDTINDKSTNSPILAVDDVYEVLSDTASSSVIELSDNSLINSQIATPTQTPIKPTKTPIKQSLIKQALLTSSKKTDMSKESTTSQNINKTPNKRLSMLSTPRRSSLMSSSPALSTVNKLISKSRSSISGSCSETPQKKVNKILDGSLRRSITKRNTANNSCLSQSAVKLSFNELNEISKPAGLRRKSMTSSTASIKKNLLQNSPSVFKTNKHNTIKVLDKEKDSTIGNLEDSKANETFTVESDEELNDEGNIIKLSPEIEIIETTSNSRAQLLSTNDVMQLVKTPKCLNKTPMRKCEEIIGTPQSKLKQTPLIEVKKQVNTSVASQSNTPHKTRTKQILNTPRNFESTSILSGDKVSLKTPKSEQSSLNIKGFTESVKTPKLKHFLNEHCIKPSFASTPKQKDVTSLVKTQFFESPKIRVGRDFTNSNLPAVSEEVDGLDEIYKTPSAKLKMILSSPKSVNVVKDLTSVELLHRTEYELTDDMENVNTVFMNVDAELMPSDEYIPETPKNNADYKIEDKTTMLSSEEAFAKLANKQICLKNYSRKERRLPVKNDHISISSDLPKTDIQNWIDTVDPNVASEEDEQLCTGLEVKNIKENCLNLKEAEMTMINSSQFCNDVSHDPLKINNTKSEYNIGHYNETDMQNIESEVTMNDISQNVNCSIDPLGLTSVITTSLLKSPTNITITCASSNISGIESLDDTMSIVSSSINLAVSESSEYEICLDENPKENKLNKTGLMMLVDTVGINSVSAVPSQELFDDSSILMLSTEECEKQRLLENTHEESTTSRQKPIDDLLELGPYKEKQNLRKSLGQASKDDSFDLEAAEEEHSAVGGSRQVQAPDVKERIVAESMSNSSNLRKTLGQNPLNGSFDLEVVKEEREKEILFENFDEHSTVSGPRQAQTPDAKGPKVPTSMSLKQNLRKTLGQKPMDDSFDLEAVKEEREKEMLFENFDENSTASGPRQAQTPDAKGRRVSTSMTPKKNLRKTLGQKPMDVSFDLEAAQEEREKEILFENFDEHSTVSGPRQAQTPDAKGPKVSTSMSLKQNLRKTLGQFPMDDSFDLEAVKEEREKEMLFENFDENSTASGPRQAQTPDAKGRMVSASMTPKKNLRKTLGQKPMDVSFDLEAAKEEREKEMLFENFDEHSTVSGPRQAQTPDAKGPKVSTSMSLKQNLRKTLGQKPMDDSFDLEAVKEEREKEMLFENFDENSTASGPRQAQTPDAKGRMVSASMTPKKNLRKTLGQKPMDVSFDLEAAKEEREKEMLFENFDEHSTVSGPRQAQTPDAKGPKVSTSMSLKQNLRKTLGHKPMDDSFDLEAVKEEREKEMLFENFDENSTASGPRQAQTPDAKGRMVSASMTPKKNLRKTLGQKPMDVSFDLEAAKEEREKEILFENFDEHSTVSGPRQAQTPDAKGPKVSTSMSLKQNLRKTLGQKPMDDSFDLEAAKEEREKEILFENFDEHSTVSGPRQAQTPDAKGPKVSTSMSLKQNLRKTLGQKPMDDSFDLEAVKEEREKEMLFENFDENSTASGPRQAQTPDAKGRMVSASMTPRKNLRKTLGQKPMDVSFDLEAVKEEREKEMLFENFDENSTASGPRQAQTPDAKGRMVSASMTPKKNLRKTLGQKPMDVSFDLEAAKEEREKEILFENFDEHSTVSGPRQAQTPDAKGRMVSASMTPKKNLRKTLGQKPMDDSFDLEVVKEEREKDMLFENFDENSTVSGPRQAQTPDAKGRMVSASMTPRKNLRKTLGQKPMDVSFDLEAAKEEREKEILFENFDEHSTVSGPRQAQTPDAKGPKVLTSMSLKQNLRKTLGQKPMDDSFDLEAVKEEREKEMLFENFDENSTSSGPRQAQTPDAKGRMVSASRTPKKNLRKTLGQKPMDVSFDLEAAKEEREKEILFENFDEHSTVSGPRQAQTPDAKGQMVSASMTPKKNLRKTLGQKPMDDSFDLEAVKEEREKEMLFENFDENSTVSGPRQAQTPDAKGRMVSASMTPRKNLRKTLGQKPMDVSFDLEAAKEEREKEILFENFDEHSTVSGPRQAQTPDAKGPKVSTSMSLKQNLRKTLGQKPMDDSFDLEAVKEEREKEMLFENFDENSTASGPRQAQTPDAKGRMVSASMTPKKNLRKTLGQKPMDVSFDLEAAKEEREKEILFENFDEHSTVSGPRQAQTPDAKGPKVSTSMSLKQNLRKTLGQKPMDDSFDLEAVKEEREKEMLFENFDENSTSSGPRQAQTPDAKGRMVSASRTPKKNLRKTLGQKPMDVSFDLEAAKEEREKEILFKNFDEHSTVSGPRQAQTPDAKGPKVSTSMSLKQNLRKTLGQKPMDDSFDLEAVKEEREKEMLFENFDENSTASGPRQAQTPDAKGRMVSASMTPKKNLRKTLGQKPMDVSFDLEAAKEEREKEILFENFDEHSTVSGPRQAQTPDAKGPKVSTSMSLKQNLRKTLGQKPMDDSFDLEAVKEEREKEMLFENFDENSTASGPRQAQTPDAKGPNVSESMALKQNLRKTLGQKPMDDSFDIEAAKEEREKEMLFENFDEHSTVSGPRQAQTADAKVPKDSESTPLKHTLGKTLGQKPMDDSFDLEADKEEREKEILFENFDENLTASGPFDLEVAKEERKKELLFKNFNEDLTVSEPCQTHTSNANVIETIDKNNCVVTVNESLEPPMKAKRGKKPAVLKNEVALFTNTETLPLESFGKEATKTRTRNPESESKSKMYTTSEIEEDSANVDRFDVVSSVKTRRGRKAANKIGTGKIVTIKNEILSGEENNSQLIADVTTKDSSNDNQTSNTLKATNKHESVTYLSEVAFPDELSAKTEVDKKVSVKIETDNVVITNTTEMLSNAELEKELTKNYETENEVEGLAITDSLLEKEHQISSKNEILSDIEEKLNCNVDESTTKTKRGKQNKPKLTKSVEDALNKETPLNEKDIQMAVQVETNNVSITSIETTSDLETNTKNSSYNLSVGTTKTKRLRKPAVKSKIEKDFNLKNESATDNEQNIPIEENLYRETIKNKRGRKIAVVIDTDNSQIKPNENPSDLLDNTNTSYNTTIDTTKTKRGRKPAIKPKVEYDLNLKNESATDNEQNVTIDANLNKKTPIRAKRGGKISAEVETANTIIKPNETTDNFTNKLSTDSIKPKRGRKAAIKPEINEQNTSIEENLIKQTTLTVKRGRKIAAEVETDNSLTKSNENSHDIENSTDDSAINMSKDSTKPKRGRKAAIKPEIEKDLNLKYDLAKDNEQITPIEENLIKQTTLTVKRGRKIAAEVETDNSLTKSNENSHDIGNSTDDSAINMSKDSTKPKRGRKAAIKPEIEKDLNLKYDLAKDNEQNTPIEENFVKETSLTVKRGRKVAAVVETDNSLTKSNETSHDIENSTDDSAINLSKYSTKPKRGRKAAIKPEIEKDLNLKYDLAKDNEQNTPREENFVKETSLTVKRGRKVAAEVETDNSLTKSNENSHDIGNSTDDSAINMSKDSTKPKRGRKAAIKPEIEKDLNLKYDLAKDNEQNTPIKKNLKKGSILTVDTDNSITISNETLSDIRNSTDNSANNLSTVSTKPKRGRKVGTKYKNDLITNDDSSDESELNILGNNVKVPGKISNEEPPTKVRRGRKATAKLETVNQIVVKEEQSTEIDSSTENNSETENASNNSNRSTLSKSKTVIKKLVEPNEDESADNEKTVKTRSRRVPAARITQKKAVAISNEEIDMSIENVTPLKVKSQTKLISDINTPSAFKTPLSVAPKARATRRLRSNSTCTPIPLSIDLNDSDHNELDNQKTVAIVEEEKKATGRGRRRLRSTIEDDEPIQETIEIKPMDAPAARRGRRKITPDIVKDSSGESNSVDAMNITTMSESPKLPIKRSKKTVETEPKFDVDAPKRSSRRVVSKNEPTDDNTKEKPTLSNNDIIIQAESLPAEPDEPQVPLKRSTRLRKK